MTGRHRMPDHLTVASMVYSVDAIARRYRHDAETDAKFAVVIAWLTDQARAASDAVYWIR